MMRRSESLLIMLNTHINVARRGKTLFVMLNIIFDVARRDKTLVMSNTIPTTPGPQWVSCR
jgi:hypothetical protein